jgi:hypothetical protein
MIGAAVCDVVGTEAWHSRRSIRGTFSFVATKATTPWGEATVLDELRLEQRAGERKFASLVQLLEVGKRERLVRFAYATEGVARRGPVTLRAADLQRLGRALEDHPELARVLGWGGGGPERS